MGDNLTTLRLGCGELLEHTNEGETRLWPAGEREGEHMVVEDFGTDDDGYRFATGRIHYPTDQGD